MMFRRFENWELEFIWNLEFEIWCLFCQKDFILQKDG